MERTTDVLAGAQAAADYLGLSRRAIYYLTEEGHLPVVRLGRKLFYSRRSLDAVLAPLTAANDIT